MSTNNTSAEICRGRPVTPFEAAAYRRAVWDRRDAIATAQAFHNSNPEHGIVSSSLPLPDDAEFDSAVAQAISLGRALVIDITTRKILA